MVPSIVGLFSEEAGDVAADVVKAGMELTGASTEDEAVHMLKSSPELLAKYEEKVLDIELAFYREDTRRMEIVNTTMRAEIAGTGLWKTGWRPAYGWISAVSFGVTIFGLMGLLAYTVIASPEDLADVVGAIKDVTTVMVSLWTVALTVLGVAVWKRSDDKKIAVKPKSGNALGKAVSGFRDLLKRKE